MRKNLLYVSTNDGSDARISKELRTLSEHYDVHFYGFMRAGKNAGAALAGCKSYHLAAGSPRAVVPLVRYVLTVAVELVRYKDASVHVVNEELLAIFYIFLLRKWVVLDVFDSIFLRMNKPGEKAYLAKRILYWLPQVIIVTDDNRKELLPKFARRKSIVIPNVPRMAKYPNKVATREGSLVIYYVGSLSKDRGSSFIEKLLSADERISVVAAGWIYDTYTSNLLDHPRVTYIGVLPQADVNSRIASDADYLLAIYPLHNDNNRNASPNKIFDSLHTRTPVIISTGTYASRVVEELGIGMLVEEEGEIDFDDLSRLLFRSRTSFCFEEHVLRDYAWERYEAILLSSHEQRRSSG
ncbi:hypothetical protein [Oceanicola granulosus]|uniref:hypothetical protein n=1 Tax=Oceanicola granulosus TaxID=252302 RepID=UPI0012EA242E|nr:hypothetical protein [Oceanicola granulosus]